MEYKSTKEMALKWNISPTRITILAKQGRISGAILFGKNWLIPSEALKPLDNREKRSRKIDNCDTPFRYPIYVNDPKIYEPIPLSDDEKKLKEIQLDYLSFNFEKAFLEVKNLLQEKPNIYIEISSLYFACILSVYFGDYSNFEKYYYQLSNNLNKDFLFKQDVSVFLQEVNAYFGFNEKFVNDSYFSKNHSYHISTYPHYLVLNGYALTVKPFDQIKNIPLTSYEIDCKYLELSGYYFESYALHITLYNVYSLIGKWEESKIHIKKALEFAKQYNFYILVAEDYLYLKSLFDEVFNDFDEEFVNKIKAISTKENEAFGKFTNAKYLSSIHSVINKEDYILLLHVLQKESNKEIAANLGLPISTVCYKLNRLYNATNTSSKNELIEFYYDSLSKGGFTN